MKIFGKELQATEIKGCLNCGRICKLGEWIWIESEPEAVHLKYNVLKKLGKIIEVPSICPSCRKQQP